MPITFTVTAYKANELEEDVRKQVLDQFRDINVRERWYIEIYKSWMEKLEDLGFSDIQINHSGFYSQGDGASFTAKGLDLLPFMRAEKLGNQYRLVLNLAKEGRVAGCVRRNQSLYCHENTVFARLAVEEIERDEARERVWGQTDELEKNITLRIRELSKEIYKELEERFDFLTSDEQVEASLVAHDYLFDEEGHQIYYYVE
jgi:hypothetical protein